MNKKIKPFLKWAGGKKQLLPVIMEKLPQDIKQTNRYVEPFIGAGAVFFDFARKQAFEEYIINDINEKLINLYLVIRDNVEALIGQLVGIREEYFSLTEMTDKEKYYYERRQEFNDTEELNIRMATLFIFLNKTCFNGLYRENSSGAFNVPFGKAKNPSMFEEDQLREISSLLNIKDEKGNLRVKIYNKSFEELAENINEHTFVYLDPPYRPITVGGFNAYNKSSFNDEEQIKLAAFYTQMDAKGAKLMLSNSDPKNLDSKDEFFDELYHAFHIERVAANRMINSDAKGRGAITEILVCNYYLSEGGIMRDFNEWLSKFRMSISGYDYYINFNKVYDNVEKMKVELNILNVLIGSKNIEDEFVDIVKRYPETLKCIPILLAVRQMEIYAQDDEGAFLYHFNEQNYSIEQYKVFMRKTGLFELLSERIVNNLIDYVLGVEVGLDSNGRKNRGGHQMEDLVESFINKSNVKEYYKEMYLTKVEEKWNVDLSSISANGTSTKRFDFVIKTENHIYLVETNFYGGTGGGSKLNETARSYKMISEEAKHIEGVSFVWFTDGTAWKSARRNLEETFKVMEHIYSIDDLENGIMNQVFV